MYSAQLTTPEDDGARSHGGRAPETEDRTRDRVLQAVLKQGPVSAAELGESLGFTPAAVRRHLDSLSKQGLVEVKVIASQGAGAGRPARRYVLSQRGQTRLGNDYLDIAADALTELADAVGEEAVNAFAARRFGAMERRYRPIVEAAGEDVTARAEALAGALAADGFVGYTREVGATLPEAMQSVQLCQGHCPIQGLAAEFPDFCDEETKTFARLLGVDVRRLSTLAGGGHVCTTHVPVGRHKTPQRAEKRTRIKINKQERPR